MSGIQVRRAVERMLPLAMQGVDVRERDLLHHCAENTTGSNDPEVSRMKSSHNSTWEIKKSYSVYM